MKPFKISILCLGISLTAFADEETNSGASTVEANQELPKILYVVPWKESSNKKSANPKLVLHDLMGDLYEPQLASDWVDGQ